MWHYSQEELKLIRCREYAMQRYFFFFREVTLVSSKLQRCILLLETPLSFHRIGFLTAFHRCDSFPALSFLLYYSFPLRYLAKKQTCSSESDCLYKPSGAFLFKFDASSLRRLPVLDFSHYLLLKNRRKNHSCCCYHLRYYTDCFTWSAKQIYFWWYLATLYISFIK